MGGRTAILEAQSGKNGASAAILGKRRLARRIISLSIYKASLWGMFDYVQAQPDPVE
jgi:hypothetical protein